MYKRFADTYVEGRDVKGTPVRKGFVYCYTCGYEGRSTTEVTDHFEAEHLPK